MPSALDSRRRGPGRSARVAIVFAVALALAVVVMALAGSFSGDDADTRGASSAGARVLSGAAGPQVGPAGRRRTPIAVVVHPTALRTTPGGRRLGRISTETEFKSARVLAVVGRRGGWLRVIASELPNGKRGWIDARDVQPGTVDYAVRVDLSARRVEVMRAGRVIRRVRAAVGEQGTPTPTGRFAVTDKVPFTDRGSPYGCCALALTAHQPNTPSEWSGGDRVAIHATPAKGSIGQSVTLGCMRVPDADARWLINSVPLGTQVSIRA